MLHPVLPCPSLPDLPQAALASRAALRCGLGGTMWAGMRELTIGMRGAALAKLQPLIPLEHKKLPPELLEKAVSSVRSPSRRHYSVARQGGSVLCVRVQLEGGPALIRTADGIVLQWG